MAFSDYSTIAGNNGTIAGQSVAEGTTSPGTINLAIRTLMADGRTLYDQVNALDLSAYAGLASPAFTGQPTVATKGAILFHNNSANLSGKIFIQASGGSAPTMSNGDWLLEY